MAGGKIERLNFAETDPSSDVGQVCTRLQKAKNVLRQQQEQRAAAAAAAEAPPAAARDGAADVIAHQRRPGCAQLAAASAHPSPSSTVPCPPSQDQHVEQRWSRTSETNMGCQLPDGRFRRRHFTEAMFLRRVHVLVPERYFSSMGKGWGDDYTTIAPPPPPPGPPPAPPARGPPGPPPAPLACGSHAHSDYSVNLLAYAVNSYSLQSESQE